MPGAKNICVYAASSDAVAPVYTEAAQTLGTALARHGHTLIYGAGNIGLMGVIARAVHAHGGRVVGVIPEKLRDLELAYREADELIVTTDMRERKALMERRADAFITLPGGFGTLEEILEVIVLKQLWYHDKPLVFLNINGIYDGLLRFFDRLIEEHFIKDTHRDLYYLADDPEGALDYIEHFTPVKPHGKWF